MFTARFRSCLLIYQRSPGFFGKSRNPNKDALADLAGPVLASLRNHKGKGIERTNEGTPPRRQLNEAAN